MQRIREIFLIQLISFLHWLFRLTWRIKRGRLPHGIQDRIEEGKPVVFGHLHQDDISLTGSFARTKVAVLVSHSKDGNLLAGFFQKLGWRVARGSSSRGAVSGFLELLKMCQEEGLSWITFAVDGPRGPLGRAKPGIFKLAALLDAPVVPVVARASRRWIFHRSWSKTFLPKPFSRVEIRFLESLDSETVKKLCAQKAYDELSRIFDERIAEEKSGYF